MLEDTVRIFEPVAFTSSDKFSGDFQVHFVQDLASFESTYGQTARADLEIDGCVRIYEKDIPAAGAPDSKKRLLFFLEKPDQDPYQVEDFLGNVFKKLKKLRVSSFDLGVPSKIESHRIAYYVEIANYYFELKTSIGKHDFFRITKVNIVSPNKDLVHQKDFHYFHKLGTYKSLCRDFGNSRANTATTTFFVEDAKTRTANSHGKVKLTAIVGGEALRKERLELLRAVGGGSSQPPALLNLCYKGNPETDFYLAFVGKGLVFDQGGMDFKTAASSIHEMYTDKCGASAVYAAFWCAVELGLKVNITATLGLAENTLSGSSYRPSDIITSHAGLTVEVTDTDAEGRLVLADCMSWTQEHFKVSHMVELSTLTGAIGVALYNRAGIFGNSADFSSEILSIAEDFSEHSHVMPILHHCKKEMDGKHTDLRNYPMHGKGGAITAAVFLAAFVRSPDMAWVHWDIAPISDVTKPMGLYTSEGCTGFGVGTLVELAKRHSKE